MRKPILIFLACWVGWGFIAAPAGAGPAPQAFALAERKTPEGYSVYEVYGMNNRGDVVGDALKDGKHHAFLWAHDKEWGIPLPPLAGYDQSTAFAINDAGLIAGCSYTVSDWSGTACLWEQGTVRALPIPSDWDQHRGTCAVGINNQGQAVGYGTSPNKFSNYLHALLWEGGQAQDIGMVNPYPDTRAWCINDQGLVGVEGGNWGAFLWSQSGGVQLLGSDKVYVTNIYAINGRGQVAGEITRSGEQNSRPAIWTNGAWSDLASLVSGAATGVNDQGGAVGVAKDPGGSNQAFPFLWQEGRVTNLQQALTNREWSLSFGRKLLNNSLQIATAASSGGIKEVVVLKPVRNYRFRLTDLGPGVIPHGLNDLGDVVGEREGRAFHWYNGKELWWHPEPSAAWGISNNGKKIAGFLKLTSESAVLWDRKGVVTPLAGLGGSGSNALDLTDSLAVVGAAAKAGDSRAPCLWLNGQPPQQLVTNYGFAHAINKKNWIAGYYYELPGSTKCKAFLWKNGVLHPLPGEVSIALGLNDQGEVAGGQGSLFDWMTPVIWDGQQQAKFISNLAGRAVCINNAGQAVGFVKDTYLKEFAFIWDQERGRQNLNDLVDPLPTGWQLEGALAVNCYTQIIGVGTYEGVRHGFLLDRTDNVLAEFLDLLLGD